MVYAILIDPFRKEVTEIEFYKKRGWMDEIRKLVNATDLVKDKIPLSFDVLVAGNFPLGIKKEIFVFGDKVYRGKGVIVGISPTGRAAKWYGSDLEDIRQRVRFWSVLSNGLMPASNVR